MDRETARQHKLKTFDSSMNGLMHKGLFGLPFDTEDSEMIIIPVPWDVTSSFKHGSSEAPPAILEASRQIDLYHETFPEIWQKGIAMDEPGTHLKNSNEKLRHQAALIISELENKMPEQVFIECEKEYCNIKDEFNKLTAWLEIKAAGLLKEGKLAAVVGGDHSVSLGLINVLANQFKNISILQIDAHADLRKSYEGFEYSHASAMYNVLKNKNVGRLVQAGIRDYCSEEAKYIADNGDRIITFTDSRINRSLFSGKNFLSITKEIIDKLNNTVYISFDIDGLEPYFCPNTGTPVPGGLSFEKVKFLFEEIYKSGKKVVGFDLCEISPGKDNWDANVGMRILYELCCVTLASHYQ